MTQIESYQGTDNLEAMEAAHRYNAFLTDLINHHAPTVGTILDYGAGVSTFARLIDNTSRTIVCLEPDHTLANDLKDAGFETHLASQTINDQSCDFIYSLNVIEHIEDDSAAIAEMFRILKPGGTLLLYVPALQSLYSTMDKKVGHFRRYHIKGLKKLLKQNNFKVENAEYADSLGYFATLAFKWFGNDRGDLNMKGLILYDRVFFPLSRLLDSIAHPFFGKNVFALAQKPDSKGEQSVHN